LSERARRVRARTEEVLQRMEYRDIMQDVGIVFADDVEMLEPDNYVTQEEINAFDADLDDYEELFGESDDENMGLAIGLTEGWTPRAGNYMGPMWNNGEYQSSRSVALVPPMFYGDYRSMYHDLHYGRGDNLLDADFEYAYTMIGQGDSASEIALNSVAGVAVGAQGVARAVGVLPEYGPENIPGAGPPTVAAIANAAVGNNPFAAIRSRQREKMKQNPFN